MSMQTTVGVLEPNLMSIDCVTNVCLMNVYYKRDRGGLV